MPLSRREFVAHIAPAVAASGVLSSIALAADPAGGPTVDHHGGSPLADAIAKAFKDGQYVLPPLPYAYDALEPHIDRQTMELHHTKHQQAYIDNLNKAIKGLADLRAAGPDLDAAKLAGLQRDVSFNAGGHLLHTMFFAAMAPAAGGEPKGALAEKIVATFGSFAAFKTHFSKAAAGVKGSGWALLVYEGVGDNLFITESGDQDLRMIPGGQPLLGLDVWEHAYYLKYQNKRADYVGAWWNVVNWTAVDAAFVAVRKMYGR